MKLKLLHLKFLRVWRFEELLRQIKMQKILIKYEMVKARNIFIPYMGKCKFTLSNLAGHGAFIMLALSYLETEFLNLRVYAASGVFLSILFQYYREVPLWIPIRWNTLFLVINIGMITIIVKQTSDAENMPNEQKLLYANTFKQFNMKLVEFMKVMAIAERRTVKKGDKLVCEGQLHHQLHLLENGFVHVYKGPDKVGQYGPGQFVGAMSFLSWESDSVKIKLNQRAKEDYASWNSIDNWMILTKQEESSRSGSDILSTSNAVKMNEPRIGPDFYDMVNDLNESADVKKKKKSQPKNVADQAGQANVICMEDCVVYRYSK